MCAVDKLLGKVQAALNSYWVNLLRPCHGACWCKLSMDALCYVRMTAASCFVEPLEPLTCCVFTQLVPWQWAPPENWGQALKQLQASHQAGVEAKHSFLPFLHRRYAQTGALFSDHVSVKCNTLLACSEHMHAR